LITPKSSNRSGSSNAYQRRVDDGEHRIVRADAEAQSENDSHCEARILHQATAGEAQVLRDVLQPCPAPHIAGVIPDQGGVAQAALRLYGRLRGRESRLFELTLREISMYLELLREIGFEATLPHQVPKASNESHSGLYVALSTF
jgi:hypothetical protein